MIKMISVVSDWVINLNLIFYILDKLRIKLIYFFLEFFPNCGASFLKGLFVFLSFTKVLVYVIYQLIIESIQ